MVNKVELAKMIGLHKTGYEQTISKHYILNLLENGDELPTMVFLKWIDGGNIYYEC